MVTHFPIQLMLRLTKQLITFLTLQKYEKTS